MNAECKMQNAKLFPPHHTSSRGGGGLAKQGRRWNAGRKLTITALPQDFYWVSLHAVPPLSVRKNPNPFEALSTFRLFRCLPAAVLSVSAQKVPKEAARGGVELIAPALKATLPGTPPGALCRFCQPALTWLLWCLQLKSCLLFNYIETESACFRCNELLDKNAKYHNCPLSIVHCPFR